MDSSRIDGALQKEANGQASCVASLHGQDRSKDKLRGGGGGNAEDEEMEGRGKRMREEEERARQAVRAWQQEKNLFNIPPRKDQYIGAVGFCADVDRSGDGAKKCFASFKSATVDYCSPPCSNHHRHTPINPLILAGRPPAKHPPQGNSPPKT